MNGRIAHRGPDFQGTFIDADVSLGHNLLAIREGNTISRQPYHESQEWVLVFNGQIYNLEEIKAKHLQGVSIDSSREKLDTYLLYRLIETVGWDFYRYIHGMYAIALYNTKERVLRLYRDPTGQKPVYVSDTDKGFVFSSEIKGILEYGVQRDLDHEAVRIAALMGYIPGDKTLFRNITKLRPSEMMTYVVATKTCTRELFSVDTSSYEGLTLDEAIHAAATDHLQSRDLIAMNLSGGLDSSLLLHEAVQEGHTVRTYSTSFDVPENTGNYNNDAELARRLSKDYGVEHVPITVTKKDYLDLFVESYGRIEEPNYNISLPVYLKTAQVEGVNGAGHRVVLSGDGGDELFGGYPYYETNMRFHRQKQLLTPMLFSIIKNIRNNTTFNFTTDVGTWAFFKQLNPGYIDMYSPQSIERYLTECVREYLDIYKIKQGDPAYTMMMLDRVLWLASENFIRSDKLYMGESLELRSPFSYMPLRAVGDATLTKNDYFNNGNNKVWLRGYAEGKLPDYITHRKEKTGWRAPVSVWYDQEFKDLFLSIIRKAKSLSSTGIIDWERVEERVMSREGWPKKDVHIYLSLAILSDRFNLNI